MEHLKKLFKKISSDHKKQINGKEIDAENFPEMFDSLTSKSDDTEKIEIMEKLCKFAESSTDDRKRLFGSAVIIPLIKLLSKTSNEALIVITLKTIGKLFVGDIPPEYLKKYCSYLQLVTGFLFHSNQSIVEQTLYVLDWILYYIRCLYNKSKLRVTFLTVLMKRTAVKILGDILSDPKHSLYDRALYVVERLASWDNFHQKQSLLDCGLLSSIKQGLQFNIAQRIEFSTKTIYHLARFATSKQLDMIFDSKVLNVLLREVVDKPDTKPETLKIAKQILERFRQIATPKQAMELFFLDEANLKSFEGVVQNVCKPVNIL